MSDEAKAEGSEPITIRVRDQVRNAKGTRKESQEHREFECAYKKSFLDVLLPPTSRLTLIYLLFSVADR
jgi:hypothetical protein